MQKEGQVHAHGKSLVSCFVLLQLLALLEAASPMFAEQSQA